jgi:hypothetical protein
MENENETQSDDHDIDGYQIPMGWAWVSPEITYCEES